MNRVKQAALCRFYLNLIEFIENLGHGENDFTGLMSCALSFSEQTRRDMRTAAELVFYERNFRYYKKQPPRPQFVTRRDHFIQTIEGKVLSLQGER